MSNPQLWWYVARASGLVAWWLVAASVLWGLLLSTRLLDRRPAPSWLLDLHRFLGGTAMAFTAVHLAGLVADNYTHWGPADLLVPLASKWHPGPVAWGVVGFYLLVAVEATSLVMKHIPRKWWRAVHFSSFGLFVLSTVHALTAGTERANPAVQWSALLMGTAFVFLTTYRVLAPKRSRKAPSAKEPSAVGPGL